jgi:hypothetical protein
VVGVKAIISLSSINTPGSDRRYGALLELKYSLCFLSVGRVNVQEGNSFSFLTQSNKKSK